MDNFGWIVAAILFAVIIWNYLKSEEAWRDYYRSLAAAREMDNEREP